MRLWIVGGRLRGLVAPRIGVLQPGTPVVLGRSGLCITLPVPAGLCITRRLGLGISVLAGGEPGLGARRAGVDHDRDPHRAAELLGERLADERTKLVLQDISGEIRGCGEHHGVVHETEGPGHVEPDPLLGRDVLVQGVLKSPRPDRAEVRSVHGPAPLLPTRPRWPTAICLSTMVAAGRTGSRRCPHAGSPVAPSWAPYEIHIESTGCAQPVTCGPTRPRSGERVWKGRQ